MDKLEKLFEYQGHGVPMGLADTIITQACYAMGANPDEDIPDSYYVRLQEKTPLEIYNLYMQWNGILGTGLTHCFYHAAIMLSTLEEK